MLSLRLQRGRCFQSRGRLRRWRCGRDRPRRRAATITRYVDRVWRVVRVRVERVRAVGEPDDQVHFGAQVDIVARMAELGAPDEAAIGSDADRGEERQRRGDVAPVEPELAGDQHEIVARVAGDAGIAGGVRGGGGAADQPVMGARGILDHREHHPAHVGKDHPALGHRGGPLHLDRIGQVEPLAGIPGAPGDQRDRGGAVRLADAERLAGLEPGRPVPAAGDGFGRNDAVGSKGGGGQRARPGSALGAKSRPLRWCSS